MKKEKNIYSLAVVVLLSISLFSGCKTKAAKETNAVEVSMNNKSKNSISTDNKVLTNDLQEEKTSCPDESLSSDESPNLFAIIQNRVIHSNELVIEEKAINNSEINTEIQDTKNEDIPINNDKDTLLTKQVQDTVSLQEDILSFNEDLAIHKKYSRPQIAVKTNLLFDAALMPNIELEVPLGKRWSIAGEWIFPWWLAKDNSKALQILSGTLEARYWFGKRDNRPVLTGWFAGLYAGGGLYDVRYNSKGYQGEFFIAAGISGGYAHKINKSGSLRMEYSIGVGYLQTNYRHYVGMEDNKYLVWQYDGNYSWIGPTKAKVSLVWTIDFKKKGARR